MIFTFHFGEEANIVAPNSDLAKIRRFARSQDIWFRKMENKGHKIYYVSSITSEAKNLLKAYFFIETIKINCNNVGVLQIKVRLSNSKYCFFAL
jgi:hypothetical protein